MKISQIDFGQVYAIRWKGSLVRFHPLSIITTRMSGSVLTEVRGTIPSQDNCGEGHVNVTIKPDKVLAPYTDYAELVAKKNAEATASKAKLDQEQDERFELARLLYQLVNLPVPDDLSDYSGKIRARWTDSVDIHQPVIPAMIEAIKDVLQARAFIKGSVTPILIKDNPLYGKEDESV